MRAGDLAPEFSLQDQDGVERSLTGLLAQGPVVLFFYPAAFTTGCTAQSCHFRDLAAEFAALGAQRVGISMDDVARQREFATQNKFDYPLLSDTGGHVAALYGVRRAISMLKVKRTTFVIGTDRHLIDVIHSELNMNAHADRALQALRSRQP